MSRIARVVVPGYPHHVTQRGSRRMPTFFVESDYLLYKQILSEQCKRYGLAIWAYCLMPNHVHLVAVPETENGLSRPVGFAHRRYAIAINAREGWSGHLWQERFASFVMDESYLMAAVRYVEMNPVRAGLVDKPDDYAWSSAKAHFAGKDDELVDVRPMLDRVDSWSDYLAITDDVDREMLKHTNIGRPVGQPEFITGLEQKLGRSLRPQKVGRKAKR